MVPQRNLIIFLTFALIFVTLVVQGLTLPALIRRLGLSGTASASELEEEETARREMISTALASIQALRSEGTENPHTLDQLEHFYQRRLALLGGEEDGPEFGLSREEVQQYDRIAQRLRAVERTVALQLRDKRKIHDEVLRDLERELDLLDARFG